MVQARETWKPWNVGRSVLQLPPTALLERQTQVVEDITLTFEPANVGESLQAVLQRRSAELKTNGRSPLKRIYHWTEDTGAVLYVNDVSTPDYYEIEARRLLPGRMLVAVTSADKKFEKAMTEDVKQVIAHFENGDGAIASVDRFGMQGGSLHEAFRHQEDVLAAFNLPETKTIFEFSSRVVAEPVTVDLFQRTANAIAASKADKQPIHVLKQGHREIAGQLGDESITSDVGNGYMRYDVRFETPGIPNLASMPHLDLHFATLSGLDKPLNEKEFIALWDTIRAGIKVVQ